MEWGTFAPGVAEEGGLVDRELEESPEAAKPVVLTPVSTPGREGLRVQHLMYAIGVSAILAWTTMMLGLWFLTGSIFLLVAGAIGLAVVLVRRAAMQQESLLWALAIASERSMPLAPAALAFGEQFSGSYQIRVQILADELNEGATLPEALDKVRGLLNPESELLVRVGWATGTLPQSLRLAAAAKTSRQATWGALAGRFAYFGFILFDVQVVSGFLLYFIAPKYQSIFQNFGIPLPWMTQFTLRVTHSFVNYFYLSLPILLLEVALFAAVPLGLFGLFNLNIPWLDYFFRRRHSTLILRALALTAEGDRPINEGLATLAKNYPSSWVRKRLVLVRKEAEGGADWIESLGDHGLLRPLDEAVLASALRAGNLPWALGEMADANDRRLGYRLQLMIQMLFPFLVLALGVLVLIFAVAYFSPVVRLIERLT